MPYQLRSHAAASEPPADAGSSLPKRCRIVVWLKPRDPPAPVEDPLEAQVDPAPLEPLFLGLDDKTGSFGSPAPPVLVRGSVGPLSQDYSPASPPHDQYNVNMHPPPWDLTTPEHQAAWEAELACSPPPPPTVDEVIDTVLASS
ncbi:hypothetical protein NDA13_003363 [Ustilago tritici]|nr:hypothetical protein NDA13_003353 [Ustilago tritici]KAJ1027910.1 hypothetical protein NDA13_003363 [Ustilago tritici]